MSFHKLLHLNVSILCGTIKLTSSLHPKDNLNVDLFDLIKFLLTVKEHLYNVQNREIRVTKFLRKLQNGKNKMS